MENIENIYLRALQIGYESKNNGISYNELRNQLKKENYEVKDDIFRYWYYENFGSSIRRSLKHNPNAINLTTPNGYDDTKHSLFSDAIMDYVDYLELKEARKSSQQALKNAKKSITLSEKSIVKANQSIKLSRITLIVSVGLSIIALIINIVFSINPQKVEVLAISPQAQEQATNTIFCEKAKDVRQNQKIERKKSIVDSSKQRKNQQQKPITEYKQEKDTLEFQSQK